MWARPIYRPMSIFVGPLSSGPAHPYHFLLRKGNPQTNPHPHADDDVRHRRRRHGRPPLRRIRHAGRPRQGPRGLLQGNPALPKPYPRFLLSAPLILLLTGFALLVSARREMPSTRAWRSTRTRSPQRSPPLGSSTPPTARSAAPTSPTAAARPGYSLRLAAVTNLAPDNTICSVSRFSVTLYLWFFFAGEALRSTVLC
jgi:hypothetical protein